MRCATPLGAPWMLAVDGFLAPTEDRHLYLLAELDQ
jgi:hypothetical protein